MGSWWKVGEEINLAAINEKSDEILFGKIKYSTRKTKIKVLNNLKERV
ncbi:DUF234 domain-containing protein [Methanosarcina siciliae]